MNKVRNSNKASNTYLIDSLEVNIFLDFNTFFNHFVNVDYFFY